MGFGFDLGFGGSTGLDGVCIGILWVFFWVFRLYTVPLLCIFFYWSMFVLCRDLIDKFCH